MATDEKPSSHGSLPSAAKASDGCDTPGSLHTRQAHVVLQPNKQHHWDPKLPTHQHVRPSKKLVGKSEMDRPGDCSRKDNGDNAADRKNCDMATHSW